MASAEDHLPFESVKLFLHLAQFLRVKLLVGSQTLFQPQQAIRDIVGHSCIPQSDLSSRRCCLYRNTQAIARSTSNRVNLVSDCIRLRDSLRIVTDDSKRKPSSL